MKPDYESPAANLRSEAMKPDYERGNVRLWNRDAFAFIPAMDMDSVDAIITDPPYAEKTHAGARGARPGVGLTTVPIVTFDSIGDEAFLTLCEQCVRISRRWVLMTCDWRHAAVAENSDRCMPSVVRVGVWIKPDAAPQFTGDRPGTGWEAVLMLHRPGRKRWNGGGHHAVWTCGVERGNVHPTQKPLRLLREWLSLFTEPGETVFDPFMGSGSTIVACIRAGRACWGCEIDPRYFDLACRRIDAAFDAYALIDPTPPAVRQGALFAEEQQ